jgi:hypothetical protein
MVTERVNGLLRTVGVKMIDHIITDGPSFYSFDEGSVMAVESSPAPWEVVPREKLTRITGDKQQLASIAAALRQGDPGHIIFVSTGPRSFERGIRRRLRIRSDSSLRASTGPRSFERGIDTGTPEDST